MSRPKFGQPLEGLNHHLKNLLQPQAFFSLPKSLLPLSESIQILSIQIQDQLFIGETSFTSFIRSKSRFSCDVTAAMLVYRTILKKVFWEFDSIIMQNLSDILLLFCSPTWPSHYVSENQEFRLPWVRKTKPFYVIYHDNRNALMPVVD